MINLKFKLNNNFLYHILFFYFYVIFYNLSSIHIIKYELIRTKNLSHSWGIIFKQNLMLIHSQTKFNTHSHHAT